MIRWFAALAAVLAAGCASMGMPDVAPGQTEAEVRKEMGNPAMELKKPGGDTFLYYTYYPGGRICNVAVIGTDGKLVRMEQRLTAENIYGIKKGMKDQAVRELLGPPRVISRLPNQNLIVWEYPWIKSSSEKRILWVHYTPDDGVVFKVVEAHDEVAEPTSD